MRHKRKQNDSVIKYMAAMLIFIFTEKFLLQYQWEKKVYKSEERADRNARIIKVFDLWMQRKHQGKRVCDFLAQNNFYTIAIYGVHFLGERLYDELRRTGICVSYGIDKNAAHILTEMKVVFPEDKLEKVDAIVVTPVFYFNEIERQLSQKINCPIISLEDILENL